MNKAQGSEKVCTETKAVEQHVELHNRQGDQPKQNLCEWIPSNKSVKENSEDLKENELILKTI